MTKFSQRIGARPPPSSGLHDATEALRTAAWNLLQPALFDDGKGHENGRLLYIHLNLRTDLMGSLIGMRKAEVGQHWFTLDWPEFFDLFEFAVGLVVPSSGSLRDRWFQALNAVMEAQGCAYRFVSGQLAPITNDMEIAEVQTAANGALSSVAEHISAALSFLPPRTDPSPRNSIKESISAVEATLKALTGKSSATLGDGIKHYESQRGPLHAGIKRGLEQLYGFTNGPEGIRHALIEEATGVTVDDARFMLVACSAFSNYLVALSAQDS